MTIRTIILLIILSFIYYLYDCYKQKVFFSTKSYPQLKHIEENWETISSEIPPFNTIERKQYYKRTADTWNTIKGKELTNSLTGTWLEGHQGDSIWYNYPLIYHNKVVNNADKDCPKTISLLKKIPYVKVAGYSLLLPNTKLPSHIDHTGIKYNSMASNLLLSNGIEINDANLYIKNEKGCVSRYRHQLGRMVIFDSTYEHHVDNNDPAIRYILYIDFKLDPSESVVRLV